MYVVSFLYIAHLFAQLIQSIDYNATSVEEDNNKPRIVGGVSCNIEDRPFMVNALIVLKRCYNFKNAK